MTEDRLQQLARETYSNATNASKVPSLDAAYSVVLSALRTACREQLRKAVEIAALEKVEIADASDEVYNMAINHVCAALERAAAQEGDE